MRNPALVKIAALALAAAALTPFTASAQTLGQNQTRSTSQSGTLTDVAPRPAEDRSSLGAVIMMDEPVLAQREMMMMARTREPDTRAMGAAGRALQRAMLEVEQPWQRAEDAARQRSNRFTPK